MPNLIELSGLLGAARRRRIRAAMVEEQKLASRAKTAKAASRQRMRGPSAQRSLEIAEAMLAKGNKRLALAWAAQALKKAQFEGRSDIARRAQALIKKIRGSAALQAFGVSGDIEGFMLGQYLGMW